MLAGAAARARSCSRARSSACGGAAARDHAGWGRAALFACRPRASSTLPLVSPLDAAGDDDLLSAHMLQHVLIGDAAPALLLLAVRGPLLAFMVPAAVVRFTAGTRPLHAALDRLGTPGRRAARSGRPRSAVWHVPAALRRGAHPPVAPRRSSMRASSSPASSSGSLLIDPAGASGRLSVKGRAALAGCRLHARPGPLRRALPQPRPALPRVRSQAHGLFGLTPLVDQQYAGLLMMAEQFLTLGTCVALLGGRSCSPSAGGSARLLIRREREARRRERRAVGEERERLVADGASPSSPAPASPIANAAVA